MTHKIIDIREFTNTSEGNIKPTVIQYDTKIYYRIETFKERFGPLDLSKTDPSHMIKVESVYFISEEILNTDF